MKDHPWVKLYNKKKGQQNNNRDYNNKQFATKNVFQES